MVTCPNPETGHGLGLATIIGIVVGGVAALSLILVTGYCFCRSKRRRSAGQNDDDPFPAAAASAASSYFSDSKTAIQQPHHQLHPFKHWIEDSTTTTTPTTVSLMKNTSATSLPSPISLQDDHHLQPQQDLYSVVHAYPPQMEDELALSIGDTILLAYPFDDGWALGVNTTTGLKGAFPMICVTRIEPSVLPTTTEPESPTLVTSTIPRRMASKSSKSASSPFR